MLYINLLEPKSIHTEYYPKHLYKQDQDSMELLKNIEKQTQPHSRKKDDINLSGEFGGTKDKKKTA